MSLDWLIFAVIAVNSLLGIGIFLRNRKSEEHRFFAVFVIFVNLWIVSNFLENEPDLIGPDKIGLMLRFDFASAIIALYSWFRFCVAFASSRFEILKKQTLDVLGAVLTGILAVFSLFGGLIIAETSFLSGAISFVSGPLWLLYAFALLGFAVGGIVYLLLGRSKAKQERGGLYLWQFNLILVGFALSVGNALALNILQTFYPISLESSRLGLYGLTVLVGLTAYAMSRYKLFEMRLLIVRAVIFALLIAFVGMLYALAMALVFQTFFGIEVNRGLFWSGVFMLLVAMFTFQPIQKFIRRLTDRVLYKGDYNSDELLAELTHIMAGTIDLDQLTDRILEALTWRMRITKAAFLIVENHKITKVQGVGLADHQFAAAELEALFHEPLQGRSGYVLDELDEGPLKELFRRLDISAVIPISVEREEVALLVLGHKKSGEPYIQRDLNVLAIFASEAGIAIQNAKAYEQIRQFSRELEQRVEERTRELKTVQESELAKAKEVARLKDEFVFIAAHELRTPVAAIRGFLELVSEAGKHFPKDVKENLEAISSASVHLNQLITDLLEIARSEAGTMKIAVEPIDIVPIIKAVGKEVSPLALERKVKIAVKTRGVVPRVLADAAKIKEVIMNFLSNAIKYNKEGGRVDVNVFPADSEVVVEFRDTGHGIPTEQQERIFQKFFRAHAKGTEETLGTGLGLFITRMLVEKMNGKAMFSSVEGKGSTFSFSLPIVKS